MFTAFCLAIIVGWLFLVATKPRRARRASASIAGHSVSWDRDLLSNALEAGEISSLESSDFL